jgi:hypothetical protein
MDVATFERWLADRVESDKEMDELLFTPGLLLSSTENEAEEKLEQIRSRKHGGSRLGRAPNLFHEHALGHAQLWQDYFAEDCIYPPSLFRRRFRMRRELYNRIHSKIVQQHQFFQQRPDAVGRPGLSSHQKMTTALRILCYGTAADAADEYVRIGESTAINAFKEFVEAVVLSFGEEYLREPTPADIKKHMEINRRRGFPGMFGSLDCSHWIWKNCPMGEQGIYLDKDGTKSLVLEAVATGDLWIWHSFIGMPGSNNDINAVDRSPLVVNLLQGAMPDVEYVVNGNSYRMFYLLCDGIYPGYTIFMKTISNPQGLKRKWFAQRQESVRKDIERAFGVLQARFYMVRQPSRWWSKDLMLMIWKAAILLRDMILEDEAEDPTLNQDYLQEDAPVAWQPRCRPRLDVATLGTQMILIADSQKHFELKEDLIEHLWSIRGNQDG